VVHGELLVARGRVDWHTLLIDDEHSLHALVALDALDRLLGLVSRLITHSTPQRDAYKVNARNVLRILQRVLSMCARPYSPRTRSPLRYAPCCFNRVDLALGTWAGGEVAGRDDGSERSSGSTVHPLQMHVSLFHSYSQVIYFGKLDADCRFTTLEIGILRIPISFV
jgi:hypothetical protein